MKPFCVCVFLKFNLIHFTFLKKSPSALVVLENAFAVKPQNYLLSIGIGVTRYLLQIHFRLWTHF